METRRTVEPDGSPVPGVIPEPIRVHHAATERAAPRRSNPVTVLLAKLLSAVRGEKDPPDAYPPTRARPVADEAVEAVPDDAGQPATAGPQTKER
jgi:hypothetical protein